MKKIRNIPIIQTKLSEPITIGIERDKPIQAFLEFVRNAAMPIEVSKQKDHVFLKKFLVFSKISAIQNGHTNINQEPA